MFNIHRLFESFLRSYLAIMIMTVNIKLDISNTQRVFTQEENTFFFSGTEQFAPIESTVVGDFNGDSITDLFCTQIGATGQIDTPVVVQLGDG